MIEFFREGGFGMWLTLIFFTAALAVAIVRRRTDGVSWALGGAVATLGSSLIGVSTGLYMTVAAAAEAGHSAEILGIGIRESVNNTVFGGILALVLATVAVSLRSVGGKGPEPV